MKAYLIDMHLLVPRSRSSAKVKVKYKGYIYQKMAVFGAFVFDKHILFFCLFVFEDLFLLCIQNNIHDIIREYHTRHSSYDGRYSIIWMFWKKQTNKQNFSMYLAGL